MSLLGLINKDTSYENESREGIVTLRILYIIQAVVLLLDIIFAGLPSIVNSKYVIIGAFVVMTAMFLLTYWMKTRPAIIAYIVFMSLFIPGLIPCFGWNGGMQDYFLIILMLIFFANLGSNTFKFILAGIVFVLRSAVIVLYGTMASGVYIDDLSGKQIHVANNAAVFLSIIAISYIFSHRENEAESKLMKYNDKLVKEANTDQLTGLHNRRRALELLDEIKASSYLGSVTIVMGDIDFFKKVNDTYGHDVGDEVLKSIAETMREVCGTRSFLTRWGGEEFLLVFIGKNGDEALTDIENLRRSIMENPIVVGDASISITMTFGMAEYDFSGDVNATIKEADDKLYMGKEAGRNRVVY
ncbi:MAG: GGDEF domain-containing protein [Lachnospiraceae bacterium]|nr:GGDEF domain-containing protein [Lachnospiraceae bacterium]